MEGRRAGTGGINCVLRATESKLSLEMHKDGIVVAEYWRELSPFFIQDAIRFLDLVHAVIPNPDNEMSQAAFAHDTSWDFISLMPNQPK